MVESEGQVIHHADTLDDNFVLRYANRHLNKPMRFSFAYILYHDRLLVNHYYSFGNQKQIVLTTLRLYQKLTLYVCMRQGGWIWVLGIS